MKKFSLLPVFVLLALALSACGGSPGPVQIEMDMTEFAFSPSTITVAAGAEVELTLTNSGALEHEVVIMLKPATLPFDADDEANIHWEYELETGESGTMTFTAPTEPGEYQIVCGIAGHLEGGMEGTLIVEP